MRFVSITMHSTCSCHIILQKSDDVFDIGPEIKFVLGLIIYDNALVLRMFSSSREFQKVYNRYTPPRPKMLSINQNTTGISSKNKFVKAKQLFAPFKENKMCLWNTMSPIMANSNEGQDHKDKYFDTSRKILSQEMIMCNMEAFSILSWRSYDQCQFFFNWSNVKV